MRTWNIASFAFGRARNERSSFTKARCEYDHERKGTEAREPVNPLICLQGL